MAAFESRENVQLHFVAICSLGALLSMIVAVLGIKLRWFRHRLTFDRLPTAPKNDSPEDTVVVTGFYRKSTDFDNFVAIERPQSLPPIRLDKRSVQRQSRVETHLKRSTILNNENPPEEPLKITENHQEEPLRLKQPEKSTQNHHVEPTKKKAAPPPPKEEIKNHESNGRIELKVREATVVTQKPVEEVMEKKPPNPPTQPPRVSQTSLAAAAIGVLGKEKRKSGISIKSHHDVKAKGTKVRVLKQKHAKGQEKQIVTVEKKKDRSSVVQNSASSADKVLAESATFAPVAIPRASKAATEVPPPKEEKKKVEREVRTLQFADDDEIIGHSEGGYDTWDMVSRHRQSLNHLTVAPGATAAAPKPRPRDSVAVHRQKAFLMMDLSEEDPHPPRTLRDMQKERQKLSITKDYSDTEA